MANDLDRVREVIRSTRATQNLPVTLADPLIVGRLSDLFRLTEPEVPDAGA